MVTQNNIQGTAPSGLFTDMNRWLESPLGQTLLKAETNLLANMLPRRFGYHLLQIGCSTTPMWAGSPIGHKFFIAADSCLSGHEIVTDSTILPFESGSVDLVLLHHALDFSGDQHQLLREVARVLIDGGNVIIIGFNPYSCWGMRKKLQWPKKAPWRGQRLSTGRLTDWLKLLEFQVEQINHGLYALPVNSPALIKYSSIFENQATQLNWPTGGVYAISAKKQGLPMTPIQQPWKKLRTNSALDPANMPLPESVTRQTKQSDKE